MRRQQPRQWGLSRQDAAPRNPHHCSTNCRDTTDARNTPWMGNKGRDIPEPGILREVGMVQHCNSQHYCNSQHSVVLVLVEMGACRGTNKQSRDQDYFDHFPSSLFIVVRKRSLRRSVGNRATLGYQVYCRRRVTLTRFLILCAETTLARKLMQNHEYSRAKPLTRRAASRGGAS